MVIQCCPTHFSASALYRPPRGSNYFMNEVFVISRLITKFTKILSLELYSSYVYSYLRCFSSGGVAFMEGYA